MTQQGRQWVWKVEECKLSLCSFIHIRYSKFTTGFDAAFVVERITVICTRGQVPNANAVAEGWVCTIREGCLDMLLIFNQAHLRCTMRDYANYCPLLALIKESLSEPSAPVGQKVSQLNLMP